MCRSQTFCNNILPCIFLVLLIEIVVITVIVWSLIKKDSNLSGFFIVYGIMHALVMVGYMKILCVRNQNMELTYQSRNSSRKRIRKRKRNNALIM